jgi:uncharacterized protein
VGDPAPAVAVVGEIAPTPLLLVHGEDDAWFELDHAVRLHAVANHPKMIWREAAGFGHAEDGFTPAFVQRLSNAVAKVHATGQWPGGLG